MRLGRRARPGRDTVAPLGSMREQGVVGEEVRSRPRHKGGESPKGGHWVGDRESRRLESAST